MRISTCVLRPIVLRPIVLRSVFLPAMAGCVLLFCLPHSALAQTWAKTYGGASDDYGRSIQQTTDGGFVVAGQTYSFGTGLYDFWVLKLNASGNVQWQKTYGTLRQYAYSIQQTTDGGYVVAGSTESFGADSRDFWVLKLDATGNVSWQKTHGGSDLDAVYSIQQTMDGGFVVAGYTYSFGAGSVDAWVLKLNASGNVAWQKTYGGGSADGAESIQQTTDGGYIVAGYISSFGAGSADLWILKLDASGNVSWQKTYGGGSVDGAESIQQTTDGGYVVAGGTSSFGAGSIDFWVLKLDALGNVAWQKTYGGSSGEAAVSIQQTTDGGFVVAGETWSFGAGSYDFWVLKLDALGNVTWQKTYGSAILDSAASIEQTTDGGFVVAGWTNSLGEGGYDFWVLKLDANGNIDASCTFIADTAVTGVDSTVIPADTTVTGADSKAKSANTAVTGVNSTATVQELCSSSCAVVSCSASVLPGATVCQGAEQTFTATPSGGTAPYIFEWDFSYDGIAFTTMASGSTVGYTYPAAGSFSAALRVTDSCADSLPRTCLDTIAITINANMPAVAYDAALDPATTLAEACGDGDLIVEPGERWNATVQLINNSTCVTANNVKADLTVNAGSVVAAIICNNPGTYGNILAGGTSQFAYSFVVGAGAVCINDITFDVMNIASDEGAHADEIAAFSVQVGRSQTGTQAVDPLAAQNEIVISDFVPMFNAPAPAASADLAYSLMGTTDLVNCVEVALIDPFATATVVKPLGVADANPYDVTGLYTWAGTYQLRLMEEAQGCGGGGDAQVTGGTLTVVDECQMSACAYPSAPSEPSPVGSPDPLLVPTTAADQIIVEDVENETGYVVYENAIGTWYGTPSQGCLSAWVDLGATVELGYTMDPGDRWVVVSSANATGESSCGMDSAGAERNAQPGWPAPGPCP